MSIKFGNYLLIIFILSFTACKKDHMLECFKSSGETTTETRDVSPFVNIDLTDNVDLIIKPNSSFYIKVTAGENLIDGIITELSGNTLYIRNENRCNWMRSFDNTYTVEIGMDKPEVINYFGSGDINCLDTIRTGDFTFNCTNGSGSINFLLNCTTTHLNNHTGRTDIHAKGFSGVSYIYINDVGTMDASELVTYYSYLRNRSTGDMKVNVVQELGVEILYNGNIYYSGNPVKIDQQITGKGKLIHL
jgi:hypothetical protein